MIGVVSNGGGDVAGLPNGKAAVAPAAEDQTTAADNESGSPSRKAPPPPKPTSVATKETVSPLVVFKVARWQILQRSVAEP